MEKNVCPDLGRALNTRLIAHERGDSLGGYGSSPTLLAKPILSCSGSDTQNKGAHKSENTMLTKTNRKSLYKHIATLQSRLE